MPKVTSSEMDEIEAALNNNDGLSTTSTTATSINQQASGGEEEANEDMEKELQAMRQRMREMEEEQSKIQQMQTQLEKDLTGAGIVDEAKEDVDARSVYVGNVDYEASPEELQTHFQDCGPINRVTILTDKFGNPKGFAYIEFSEKEAVDQAVLLDDSTLRGRTIKVNAKRTNVPGMSLRGRGRGAVGGGGFRGAYRGGGYSRPAPRGAYRGAFGRGRGRGGGPPRGRGGYHPYSS